MNLNILRKSLSIAMTCWSLILTSMPFTAMAQTTNNKPMTAAECPTGSNSAYQWNSSLNRCMLKSDTSAQREMFEDCDALESGKAECFEKMRNQNLNAEAVSSCKSRYREDIEGLKGCMQSISGSDDGMDDKYKDSGLSFLGLGISGASTALVVANMISKKGKSAKGCTSATMFKFTSIGATVGQLYLKLGAKGDFDKLEEDYDAQVEAGDDAQFASYDYLEAQQREIVKVAKKHETVYKMTALAYGATALVAGVELIGVAGLTPCTSGGDSASGDATATSGDAAATSGDATAVSGDATATSGDAAATSGDATAASGDATAASGDAATSAAGGIFGKIGSFLGTSPGILAISAAAAGVNMFLMQKAGSQKDKAEKNAQKVADLKAKLQAALAGSSYCKTRDDLSVPRCYCYKPDNSRNTERTKSETCQALWANQDRNLYAEAGNYGSSSKKKAMGCYKVDRTWDPDCKCRQMKNDKGESACLQVPVGVNQIAALGPATGLSNVIDSLNKVYSGGFASGEIQPAQIGSLAGRINKARKQVDQKINANYKSKGQPSIEKQAEAILRGLAKSANPTQLASARNDLGQAFSGSTGISSPELTAALNKSGIVLGSVNRSAPGRASKAAKKKAGFDLYGEQAKSSGAAAYMDKKYDYSEAQNDIVERDDVSIWQVISNRYTTSGLRRLFDDEAEDL